MRELTFQGMGTVVQFVATSDAHLGQAHAWFNAAESRLSRFIETSELSQLNRAPGDTEVSEDLLAIVSLADDLRTRTAGLVDIGVGAAINAWGYDRTFMHVRDQNAEPPPIEGHDWWIRDRTVCKRAGTRFDLGGIGKGWAADQVVTRFGVNMASVGGDIRASEATVAVDVIDPWGETAARLHPGVGGLATSSRSRRRWQVGAGEACHLIDPRTMRPSVSPLWSATVTAETAADAEAGAKAVLLLGADGLAWADQQDWITGALGVWHDGNVYATTGMKGMIE